MENMFNEIKDYSDIGLDDFAGLSPSQMHQLLYGNVGEGLVKIRNIEEEINDIPLLKQIYIFLEILEREDGLKLTSVGNMPPKIVKELYGKKILIDDEIECGITKLVKETDSETIQVTRIISELSGFIRKYKGKLILTKKGKEYLKNNNGKFWLKNIIEVFEKRFNLGYFDGYKNRQAGQIAFQFSLYLLKKYGREEQDEEFYAKKYYRAFPSVGEIEEKFNSSAYTTRTFERFFRYFGFIKTIGEKRIEKKIKKTEIFDRYIYLEMKKNV